MDHFPIHVYAIEFYKRTLFIYSDAILPGDGLAGYQPPGLLMVIYAIVVAELRPPRRNIRFLKCRI
jgi:hypothetical protein